MVAGVAAKLWEMSDIVAMVDQDVPESLPEAEDPTTWNLETEGPNVGFRIAKKN